jgi:soluble lytic murein transglycosylase-like protein
VVVPDDLRPVILKAAKRCQAIPVEVFAAQIAAESGWDARAVSPSGARGIAQFMPAVWEQYGIDGNSDGVADVWDPVDAIHSAAEMNCLNRRLVRDASGDRLENTLAAYNAGFASVRRYDGVPPFPETEQYVQRILESARTIVVYEESVAT